MIKEDISMARPEKENAVASIAEKITNSTGVYLADYKGLNVEEISDLRNKLRDATVEFKVIKNTLARISVNKVGFEELLKYEIATSNPATSSSEAVIIVALNIS